MLTTAVPQKKEGERLLCSWNRASPVESFSARLGCPAPALPAFLLHLEGLYMIPDSSILGAGDSLPLRVGGGRSVCEPPLPR